MTSLTTFYLSRLIGCTIFDARENVLGKITDVYVRVPVVDPDSDESQRPQVVGFTVKVDGKKKDAILNDLQIVKFGIRYKVQCQSMIYVQSDQFSDAILLKDSILDKQIVDITGRKLVRVNDIRMVAIPAGVYVVAVDVGTEGLLRRIGIDQVIKYILLPFNGRIPSKFILWDDVEAIDLSTLSIQLSKSRSKLNTLHPSDLADIIEDLSRTSKTTLFSSLDEEQAADVLEELEVKEQIHIIESLPVEKAADVLEKMPANEAADLMDYLEDEKAEQLLHEMEPEASEEVRDLLEYPDSTVGSIMTTDVLTFTEDQTIAEVLDFIRKEEPDMESLYGLFVLDKKNELVGTITMRDLLISDPAARLEDVMDDNLNCVNDYDKLDSLSELVSKYNMLAIPVTNDKNELEGMVVVDDIIDDLLGKRRTT
ncbi:CBS domain-containing protein [Paludibacter sp.]|uniref:magnesium transporter n=1 Tax=Paludibacter sp. TaxID=1898105 RepID=UPI001352EDFA|nr:CBS domain-containing protein [Paludibacter sp.]MTK52265.1 magnesium transporter [Paludibacter sp.]